MPNIFIWICANLHQSYWSFIRGVWPAAAARSDLISPTFSYPCPREDCPLFSSCLHPSNLSTVRFHWTPPAQHFPTNDASVRISPSLLPVHFAFPAKKHSFVLFPGEINQLLRLIYATVKFCKKRFILDVHFNTNWQYSGESVIQMICSLPALYLRQHLSRFLGTAC